MVRDVCTSVLNSTTYPKKSERETVEKLIIETYPFLQDPLIDEDSKPWGSLETKIFNRFKKLQRKKISNGIIAETIPAKGHSKKAKALCWTVVPEQTEAAEVVSTSTAAIEQEWRKAKKNHDKIKDLMNITYAKRRAMVINDVQPIT